MDADSLDRAAIMIHDIGIAIVNIGPTRADELASVKVEERCGEVLAAAVASLKVSKSQSLKEEPSRAPVL